MRGDKNIVRENVRLVRTRSGLTLTAFAKKAGIGKSTVANFEAGVIEIADRTISRIANGAGLSFDDLHDPTLKDRFRVSPPVSPPVAVQPVMVSAEDEFKSMFAALPDADQELVIDFMGMLIRRERRRGRKAGG